MAVPIFLQNSVFSLGNLRAENDKLPGAYSEVDLVASHDISSFVYEFP